MAELKDKRKKIKDKSKKIKGKRLKEKGETRNPKSPGGYKTIMGTTPKISSHSPFAAEAVYGVKLLLF